MVRLPFTGLQINMLLDQLQGLLFLYPPITSPTHDPDQNCPCSIFKWQQLTDVEVETSQSDLEKRSVTQPRHVVLQLLLTIY